MPVGNVNTFLYSLPNFKIYLMTAMLIMGKYFSYLTARAVSRAVMQVEKILSHLSGGKESTFLTLRPVVKVTFLPPHS